MVKPIYKMGKMQLFLLTVKGRRGRFLQEDVLTSNRVGDNLSMHQEGALIRRCNKRTKGKRPSPPFPMKEKAHKFRNSVKMIECN